MSGSKKKMMDRINKRADQIKKMREDSRRELSYKQEVLKFLEKLEEIYIEAKHPIEFECQLNSACSMLNSRLKKFDPYVEARIMWNNPPDEEDDWTNLRALGVIIRWSKYYRNLYPEAQEEEFVDVSNLIFNDLE